MSANRVVRRLYQGSDPPYGSALARQQFHCLVLCALEHQDPPHNYPGLEVLHCPLDDNFEKPVTRREARMILSTAQEVLRRWQRGQRILIVCHQGRNRSGLVMAHTLCLGGNSADQAINLIRRARGPDALSNPQFVKHIRCVHAPALTADCQ